AKIADNTVASADILDGTIAIGDIAQATWSGSVHQAGLLADRPTASASNNGFLYFATDVSGGTLYRSDGSSWTRVAAGNTVQAADLAADSVDSSKIADGAVQSADLADSSVATSKLQDASVSTAQLGTNAVTPAEFLDR